MTRRDITPRNCDECGVPLQRDRIVAGCRCCSWECANARKRRTAVPVICARCGRELDKSQRKRAKQRGDTYCSAACRRVAIGGAVACARCGHPLTKHQMRGRRKHCSPACALAARSKPRTAPDALSATEPHDAPAQDTFPTPPAASVLWREGRIVYTVGVLNGVEVVYDGGPRVYCTLAQWPDSPAGRRSQQPRVDMSEFAMVERVGPSVWRSYPLREAVRDE